MRPSNAVPLPSATPTPVVVANPAPAAVASPVARVASPVTAPLAAPVAAIASLESAPVTGPAAAPVAQQPQPSKKTQYPPLPAPKTITITFVPDWNQEELKSPLRAASLCLLLGTANTLPHQASWCIEFNIFSAGKIENKPSDHEPIAKNGRALLWFNGANDKFKNCIVQNKTRLSSEDNLKTQSVVVRTYGDEADPNALVWVRKRAGTNGRKDLSYLRVVQGHHYYLNITFSPGSTILQMVGNQSWRPIMYLFAKRLKKGVDEVYLTRPFTNFTTHWAHGVELPMDQSELKAAQEALALEQKEYEESGVVADPKKQPPATSVTPIPPTPADAIDRRGVTLPLTDTNPFDHKIRAVVPKPPTPADTLDRKGRIEHLSSSAYLRFGTHVVPPKYITMEILQIAFKDHSLDQITLPDIDNKSIKEAAALYKLGLENISIEPTVEKFLNHNECFMAHALFEFETAARAAAQDPINLANEQAKKTLNLYSAVSQLPGWMHVQTYIYNPQQYIEGRRLNLFDGFIAELQVKGNLLMQRLIHRLVWVIALQNKTVSVTDTSLTDLAFDAEFALKVLAVDHQLLEDAVAFMHEAELKVTEMLTKNPQKFHAFRALQRKGVQWPHSTAIRQEIEAAGFVFRPMMIKRDRCICETCGVEVSGWRVWHLPLGFHNYAKHPATFRRLDERRRVIASNPESRPAVALAPVAPAAPGAGSAAAGSDFASEKPESLKDMKKGNK